MRIPALLAALLPGSRAVAAPPAIAGPEPAIAYPGVRIAASAAGTDVLTGKRYDPGKEIRLPAKSVVILEL